MSAAPTPAVRVSCTDARRVALGWGAIVSGEDVTVRLDAVDVDDEGFLERRLAAIAEAGLRFARVRTSSSKSSPVVEAAIVS